LDSARILRRYFQSPTPNPRVEFFDAEEAAIRPLIERLAFAKDKSHWGFPFRRGLFEIDRDDFACIAQAMKANWSGDG